VASLVLPVSHEKFPLSSKKKYCLQWLTILPLLAGTFPAQAKYRTKKKSEKEGNRKLEEMSESSLG
jgi:hypothetical protein